MYNENNKGDNIVPCGTPVFKIIAFDTLPLTRTLCGGFKRNSLIHQMRPAFTPRSSNLCKRTSILGVLKAELKSISKILA